MVFGLSDQDPVPLVDRFRWHFHALPRSGWLRNRRWYFGYHYFQVRGFLPEEVPPPTIGGLRLFILFVSAADFKILLPVATSWLSIAVFTDGKLMGPNLFFLPAADRFLRFLQCSLRSSIRYHQKESFLS